MIVGSSKVVPIPLWTEPSGWTCSDVGAVIQTLEEHKRIMLDAERAQVERAIKGQRQLEMLIAKNDEKQERLLKSLRKCLDGYHQLFLSDPSSHQPRIRVFPVQ